MISSSGRRSGPKISNPLASQNILLQHIPLGRFPTAKLAAHGRDGRSLKALGRRPVRTHAAPWCQCQRSVAIGRAPLPSTVKPGHRLRRPVPFPRRVFGRRAGSRAAAVDQSPACLGADSSELPRRMRTSSQNVVFWLWVARCLSTARGDRQTGLQSPTVQDRPRGGRRSLRVVVTPEVHSAGCRDRLASADSPDTTASVAGRRMGMP